MIVNFEFLGMEPIENLITCMNFKIDKVVYFGYDKVIKSRRSSTENFLMKYCGNPDVSFLSLSKNDLEAVLDVMRKAIEKETEQKNDLYFDITGGESLILVAFGILSKEFATPMHIYDIEADKLIELNKGEHSRSISRGASGQKVRLDLDKYIEMKGGVINYGLHKGIKDIEACNYAEDLVALWKVVKKHGDLWNPFSGFVRNNMIPDVNMNVNRRAGDIINALNESNGKPERPEQLNAVLDDLSDVGIILELKHADGKYSFRFKNKTVKDLIWESGSILELFTYKYEKEKSDDCKVGVHLDWDGIINPQPGNDVLNEVDVLSLRGNVPTFISCKSGKMGSNQALHALYELETVAERFGGKYAKKILVTLQPLNDIYVTRAKEMGIEIRYGGFITNLWAF